MHKDNYYLITGPMYLCAFFLLDITGGLQFVARTCASAINGRFEMKL